MPIKSRIRTIPDHPKPGIQFRDITTLLLDPSGLKAAVDQLVEPYGDRRIGKVAGIEARGFILGGAVAVALDVGFVPVRKPGKLPGDTIGQDYTLEYGTDRLEVHSDALGPDDRVLLVDDLIATGGTAEAAIALIERSGADLVGCAFVVDLPDLGGRKRIEAAGHAVSVLCEFTGD
jgi:adenine phosphoribosyltransferase